MANATDPFTPYTPLSRAMLERYAQGDLTPGERHAVELHLESDPLLREAVEGLQQPGAVQGLHALRRPGGPGFGKWAVPVIAVVLIGGAALYLASPSPVPPPRPAQPGPHAGHETVPAAVESTLQAVDAELVAHAGTTAEKPAPAAERFQATEPAPPADRPSPERMDVQPAALERDPGATAPRAARRARPSRQLVFLHGLKLVHPSELQNGGPLHLPSPGVPASEEPSRTTAPAPAGSLQPYLDFMDAPMAALANGADRRALDDLYFLLGQYPDDVNAQFYAGLACYRLGLYPRARALFQAAGANAVDSFDEEAEWYAALCTEQLAGKQAAEPAFARIAQEGGFYAAQARQRIAQGPGK